MDIVSNIVLDFSKLHFFSKASPLHLSLEANDTEITKLLIASGADIHSPTDFIQKPNDAYGRGVYNPTPIYLAAQKKNHEIVRIFLEKGCYHTPRGCFIESTLYDGDVFIAFVEQEIEKKQREEMLKQNKQVIDLLTKQTELLTTTNQEIKKLSRRVKRLKLVKNTEETKFPSTVLTSKTQDPNTPKSAVANKTSFFRQSQPQSARLPTELQQLGLTRYIKVKCLDLINLSFDNLLLPKIKKPEDLSTHDEVHLLENFKQQINKLKNEYFEHVDALSEHLPPSILSLCESLKSQLNIVLQLALKYTDNISENYHERFQRYSVIQSKLKAIFKCAKSITAHIKILDIEAISNKNVTLNS